MCARCPSVAASSSRAWAPRRDASSRRTPGLVRCSCLSAATGGACASFADCRITAVIACSAVPPLPAIGVPRPRSVGKHVAPSSSRRRWRRCCARSEARCDREARSAASVAALRAGGTRVRERRGSARPCAAPAMLGWRQGGEAVGRDQIHVTTFRRARRGKGEPRRIGWRCMARIYHAGAKTMWHM